MNRMKKGKAIGKDEIAVEMLESLGEKGLEIIKDIANITQEFYQRKTIEIVMITIPKVTRTLNVNNIERLALSITWQR